MTQALGYGQPVGGICQTAFVVEDVHASIDHFIRDCGAGPFFLLDHFLAEGQVYRGAVSKADVTIAMGFAGHMQIELIQPLDANPSVYRETIEKTGYGFHHFGIASIDVEADLANYEARGFSLAFKAPVPTGGSVAYLEGGHAAQPGFVELIPVTDMMDQHFTGMWQASQGWNGRDPIRPFL
ncbi:VOC family protein [Novosphingobium cyanobacteriorum]|uniref:VOC family protein n=1 Tax=Novosphingobium cyanobacteriorum TaxID=3024215 RepID=A0ABT6CD24_9SPHN|nr:VOC family protein [Novosphingobium cyanobacteriorum]MDF8331820.1 VOC family protein [Novosphingobium cyanobacteriorum]